MMSKSVRTTRRPARGIALIVVLGLIMAITVLSLGFLAQSQTELACGENMALRLQMDQLASSGLEHARGLILQPQEIGSLDGWSAEDQQLDATSDDYYDVDVVADANDSCNYEITCQAFRIDSGQTIGRAGLTAQLRLDPCVVWWTGTVFHFRNDWTIYGDFYAAGDVDSYIGGGLGAPLYGDVFAGGTITGVDPQGRASATVTGAPVAWPFGTDTGADVVDGFLSNHTITSVTSGTLSSNLGPFDPAHVFHCSGDLSISSNVTVTGMLLVDGNLTLAGSNITVTAGQGLPAIYTTGHLILRGASNVQINGLAVAQGKVLVGADTANLQIVGGLYAADEIVETTTDTSGYGHDAIIRNTPALGSGIVELDGAADYLQTADDTTGLQLVTDYTLSLYLRADATQNAWAGILCKTDPDGLNNHWTLQIGPGASSVIICHDTYAGGNWDTGIVVADIADGAWHHLAVVRSGTTMTSYLDGTPCLSGALAQLPMQGEGHLNIGAERTASASYLYQGALDDVRIYNRALDASEILALPSDTSLIGHWTFSESGSQLEVTAAPVASAFVVWDRDAMSGVWQASGWSSAGGAFFKSVAREW